MNIALEIASEFLIWEQGNKFGHHAKIHYREEGHKLYISYHKNLFLFTAKPIISVLCHS